MISFQALEEITGGKMLMAQQDFSVVHLLTDSRKILIDEGAVFFAIKGKHHDGHEFIQELYEKGIRQFIVEEEREEYSVMYNANILLVENAIDALQQVVASHRQAFTLPILGITGSNGKTIVKEWLGQLLATEKEVVKSPKSYNSQIGVPLSVWQINDTHEVALIEAGISQVGEMEKLQKIIQPNFGLITNIGTAHDEGFKNRKQKIKEKVKLFSACSMVFYCMDHEEIQEVLKAAFDRDKRFMWGSSSKADVVIKKQQAVGEGLEVTLTYKKRTFIVNLPFTDDASFENAMHCISFLLYHGFDVFDIQNGFNNLNKVSMRLELKRGINDCYIVDDTYNNDLAGLQIALNFLSQQHQETKKTVILSDIFESGIDGEKLYTQVAALLKSNNVDRLIGIGDAIAKYSHLFPMSKKCYASTAAFLDQFNRGIYGKEVILVKGARVFNFETIVQRLMQKLHGTVLEINLDALTNNLNYYRSKLDPATKIMVMVKALAYGSGIKEVANLLQFHRVDYLAVAYADEGVTLRENGIDLPIMVMSPRPENFDKLIEYNLEPEIYSEAILNEFLEYLKQSETQSKIHLKIDTGMNRLGFKIAQIEKVIDTLRSSTQVELVSIFSHLVGADEENLIDFSIGQVEKFNAISHQFEDELRLRPLKHICNSAGIIRFPEYHMDMVRLGIGLYGFETAGKEQGKLEVISTLKTTIIQIKEIKKSETIGYGRKGIADKDMRIATLAIGYADGFSRSFGNGVGKVLVNGRTAAIIGNVCMDMCMIDISEVEAAEGDEVEIFGENMQITNLAKSINTIPYEILTNVSERVKRVFFAE